VNDTESDSDDDSESEEEEEEKPRVVVRNSARLNPKAKITRQTSDRHAPVKPGQGANRALTATKPRPAAGKQRGVLKKGRKTQSSSDESDGQGQDQESDSDSESGSGSGSEADSEDEEDEVVLPPRRRKAAPEPSRSQIAAKTKAGTKANAKTKTKAKTNTKKRPASSSSSASTSTTIPAASSILSGDPAAGGFGSRAIKRGTYSPALCSLSGLARPFMSGAGFSSFKACFN
jgi:hypothetical protein